MNMMAPGVGEMLVGGMPDGEFDEAAAQRMALEARVAMPLRTYLATLSPECRRQLLDTLEEAAIRGARLFGGSSESTVATLLGEMDRGNRLLDVPDLWRAVSFLADHALTDVWDNVSAWDIPRTAVAALYTYTRIRLNDWAELDAAYHAAEPGRERYDAMCAAMLQAGRFVAANADDATLVETLRCRTKLPRDEIIRIALLFGRLAAVGPGFLNSLGESLSIPPHELADLPLAPADARQKWGLDAMTLRRVAARCAKLPTMVANQNQLLASQLSLFAPNPAELLNLIPPKMREQADLEQSSFAGLCEFVVGRLERHARECRLFASKWLERDLTEAEFIQAADVVIDIVEQYKRESAALGRLVRLSRLPAWSRRATQARSEMVDVLIHTVVPACWAGLRALSIYTLLPMDKPRNLPMKRQLENERQLFRVIAAISPVIEESGNRQALDGLRAAVASFVGAILASIKPTWFLAFRSDRGDALAMTAHFLCILGALGRGGDISVVTGRLRQQKIKTAELMPCQSACGRSCGKLVLGG